jgi:hypothetical protein
VILFFFFFCGVFLLECLGSEHSTKGYRRTVRSRNLQDGKNRLGYWSLNSVLASRREKEGEGRERARERERERGG